VGSGPKFGLQAGSIGVAAGCRPTTGKPGEARSPSDRPVPSAASRWSSNVQADAMQQASLDAAFNVGVPELIHCSMMS